MNPVRSQSPLDEPSVLDRLVDNELDESQRRALIASLEDRPDGWRRCALAFLENQTLQADLGALVGPSRTNTLPGTRAANGEPRPGRAAPSRWLAGLTIAASLAAAFALGRWSPHAPDDKPLPPARQVAGLETTPSAAGQSVPDLDEDSDSGQSATNSSRSNPDDFLTLVVSNVEAGDTQLVDVPLVDAESVIPRAEWDRRLPVPREIWRAWEEMGLAVTRKRRLAPLKLDDGRRVVFPVDEFEFTPLAHQMY